MRHAAQADMHRWPWSIALNLHLRTQLREFAMPYYVRFRRNSSGSNSDFAMTLEALEPRARVRGTTCALPIIHQAQGMNVADHPGNASARLNRWERSE